METTNTNVSTLQRVEQATISDDTRRLLCAWAKLQDASEECAGLLERFYEGDEKEKTSVVDDFYELTGKAGDILIDELLPAMVRYHLTNLHKSEI